MKIKYFNIFSSFTVFLTLQVIIIVFLSFSCATLSNKLYNDSLDAYKSGEYQTALSYLNDILNEDENNFEALVLRSKVYLKLNNTELAEEDINKALSLDEDYESHFIKGKIDFDKGNYQQALSHFSKSIELNKRFTEGYLNRAYTFYKINDFENALNDYELAYQLDPNSSAPLVNMGFIFGLIGENDLAIEYYSKGILVNPKDFNAYYNRGAEFLSQRKYREAISDLTNAYELDKGNTDLLFMIAETRTKLKDYQNAFSDYTKILMIDSLNSKAYYERGLISLELKREKAACDDLTKAGNLGYFDAYEKIKKHCGKKSSVKKK